jgi:ABC-2 type transport system permease protein
MFTRIAMQTGSLWDIGWQIALSIGLMVATIYGMIWLCGRIYRVGILMYGKKPNLPEIMKWIKYALFSARTSMRPTLVFGLIS